MNFLNAPTKDNLFALFLIYACLAVVLLVVQWRSRRALGLPLVYAFTLSIIHAIAAYIHTIPKYTPRHAMLVQGGLTLETTFYGFRLMVFGFAAYVLGVLICPLFVKPRQVASSVANCRELTTQLPGTLIVIAFLSFFVFAPVFRLLPSLGSLTTAGCSCSVAGIYLYCWQAFRQGSTSRLLLGLASTGLIPIITMVFMGFAGYGASAAAVIWLLVVSFYRPRWLALVMLGLSLYLGISFYLSWMNQREGIRDTVRDQRAIESRLEKVVPIFENFQWLDLSRQDHLELIDARLNQNDLAGKAWRQLEIGRVAFANGRTLWLAVIAWIPRILWPGKPVTGGGGTIVSEFTGQRFAEGTSVGVGQVMEFYINFGWAGLFAGFLVFGLALRWMDLRAAEHLAAGDQWACTRWLLPAIAFIQPSGNMSEVVGALASFAVYGTILHHLLFRKFYAAAALSPAVPVRGSAAAGRPQRRRYS